MKKETLEVSFTDDDHVWVKGKQYVSLKRMFEIKEHDLKELKNMEELTERLLLENQALRTLIGGSN